MSIALFTRDLRVHDNPVLRAAAAAPRVVALFVIDSGIERAGFASPNRAAFLADSLADLDRRLRGLGASLVLRRGAVVDEVCRVATEVGATRVHVAADVSGYAQHRQDALGRALAAQGAELVTHEGSVTAVPPGAVVPDGGDHYAVFTPYWRRWRAVARREPLDPPRRLSSPRLGSAALPAAGDLCPGERSPRLASGGERAARPLLDRWAGDAGHRDGERRDVVHRDVEHWGVEHWDGGADLAADTTSRLSPHLHFGCLSATEVLHRVGTGSEGAAEFTRQLAWRDFHHQVLAARPDAAWHDYRPRGDRWRRDDRVLRAWRQGRTGYPIVDAGMRQLTEEGWLPNRARLLVASFLTKTLYLDWRHGARHFLELLVDADIANNQLNWQWVAGTGTDTRPQRVLNPLTQARRFDPRGDYVRRWVPELAGVEGAAVHRPWRLDGGVPDGYPEPVVDLDEGRARFLEARAAR